MMNGRTNALKAIETTYNGYRFRSRLEARWAVFFDAAGIRYEYEPEGMRLGGREGYLPDFHLPVWDSWVEIKHGEVGVDDLSKPGKAARQGLRVLVLSGSPWPWDYTVWVRAPQVECGLIWMPTVQFARCEACQSLSLVVSAVDGSCQRQLLGSGCGCGAVLHWPRPGRRPAGGNRLEDAYLKARQARFEHGEQPAAPRPAAKAAAPLATPEKAVTDAVRLRYLIADGENSKAIWQVHKGDSGNRYYCLRFPIPADGMFTPANPMRRVYENALGKNMADGDEVNLEDCLGVCGCVANFGGQLILATMRKADYHMPGGAAAYASVDAVPFDVDAETSTAAQVILEPMATRPKEWPEVLAQVGPFLAYRLDKAQSVCLEGNELRISYDMAHTAERDLVAEPSRVGRLEELMAKVAGRPIKVVVEAVL